MIKKIFLKNITMVLTIVLLGMMNLAIAQERDTIVEIKTAKKSETSEKKNFSNKEKQTETNTTEKKNTKCSPGLPLSLYGGFFLLVFLGYPILSRCCWNNNDSVKLKGLALPQGSVRSMLAIAIVGSYLITLSMGFICPIQEKYFNMILTAFGSLSGAVIGFYFGNGGSGGKKENAE